jgi:hypothetical protein
MGEVASDEFFYHTSKLTYDTRLGGYRTDITEQKLRGTPIFGS